MKNKSKTGEKNLNRGRRKWFHKGEFIGLDIQSVIMTVLTMLTIAVTAKNGWKHTKKMDCASFHRNGKTIKECPKQ